MEIRSTSITDPLTHRNPSIALSSSTSSATAAEPELRFTYAMLSLRTVECPVNGSARARVSAPGRFETQDAGLDDRRACGVRKSEVFRTRPIYCHGTAGKDTHSLTRGKLRKRCRISKW